MRDVEQTLAKIEAAITSANGTDQKPVTLSRRAKANSRNALAAGVPEETVARKLNAAARKAREGGKAKVGGFGTQRTYLEELRDITALTRVQTGELRTSPRRSGDIRNRMRTRRRGW